MRVHVQISVYGNTFNSTVEVEDEQWTSEYTLEVPDDLIDKTTAEAVRRSKAAVLA